MGSDDPVVAIEALSVLKHVLVREQVIKQLHKLGEQLAVETVRAHTAASREAKAQGRLAKQRGAAAAAAAAALLSDAATAVTQASTAAGMSSVGSASTISHQHSTAAAAAVETSVAEQLGGKHSQHGSVTASGWQQLLQYRTSEGRALLSELFRVSILTVEAALEWRQRMEALDAKQLKVTPPPSPPTRYA
jgi:hypothetical protein